MHILHIILPELFHYSYEVSPKCETLHVCDWEKNTETQQLQHEVKILMIKIISLTQKPPETHGSNIISVTRESVQKPPASDKA